MVGSSCLNWHLTGSDIQTNVYQSGNILYHLLPSQDMICIEVYV